MKKYALWRVDEWVGDLDTIQNYNFVFEIPITSAFVYREELQRHAENSNDFWNSFLYLFYVC